MYTLILLVVLFIAVSSFTVFAFLTRVSRLGKGKNASFIEHCKRIQLSDVEISMIQKAAMLISLRDMMHIFTDPHTLDRIFYKMYTTVNRDPTLTRAKRTEYMLTLFKVKHRIRLYMDDTLFAIRSTQDLLVGQQLRLIFAEQQVSLRLVHMEAQSFIVAQEGEYEVNLEGLPIHEPLQASFPTPMGLYRVRVYLQEWVVFNDQPALRVQHSSDVEIVFRRKELRRDTLLEGLCVVVRKSSVSQKLVSSAAIPCVFINMSPSGAGLFVDQQLPERATIQLGFTVHTRPICIFAEVLTCQQRGKANLVRVRFVDVANEAKVLLYAFCNDYLDQPATPSASTETLAYGKEA